MEIVFSPPLRKTTTLTLDHAIQLEKPAAKGARKSVLGMLGSLPREPGVAPFLQEPVLEEELPIHEVRSSDDSRPRVR